MYKVVNKTAKKISFWGEVLEPNEITTVTNNVFDTKSVKDEELGVCEIYSEYGEHTCQCYGNLTCTPARGKDGVVFSISEK